MNDDGNPSARPSTRSEDGRKERKKERKKEIRLLNTVRLSRVVGTKKERGRGKGGGKIVLSYIIETN